MSERATRFHPAGTGEFSATDLRRRMAEREVAKAAEEMHHLKEQEDKQKAVMEEFHKPPARTPDQLMELVTQLVSRAAERGQSEVQILSLSQFPVQRWRPKDQQLVARMGEDLRGPTQARL